MKPQEFTLPNIGPKLANTLQLYVPRPKKVNEILKPTSGFMYSVVWTSTAIKTKNGYTSEWVEWCKNEMPHWLSEEGFLYKVNSGAKILSMNTDKDAFKIANYYGVSSPKNQIEMFTWAQNFPWDKIEDDFDGVHHVPTGSRIANLLMSSWDVESTAWFNTNVLDNIREVKIDIKG